VLEANAKVNGRGPFSHPHPSETPQPISMSCQIYYYVPPGSWRAKFGWNRFGRHGSAAYLHGDICRSIDARFTCTAPAAAGQSHYSRVWSSRGFVDIDCNSIFHVCMYVCMYVIFITRDKRTSNNKHKKQSQNDLQYKAAKPKKNYKTISLDKAIKIIKNG